MRIERHQVRESVIAATREDFQEQLDNQVRIMRMEPSGSWEWWYLSQLILDDLAALSAGSPALDGPEAEVLLRNAALAAGGAVRFAAYHGYERFSVGLDPDLVNFGLIYEIGTGESRQEPLDPQWWADALCLVILADSAQQHGEAFDFTRVGGEEVAGDPVAELAKALLGQACGYIVDDDDASYPPSEEEKLAALDAALARIRDRHTASGEDLLGHPSAIALRALRAVAADEREAYNAELAALVHLHSALPGIDSRPSSLLPLLPLALAALTHRNRGWLPAVESDYLPRALVTGFRTAEPFRG